MPGQPQKLLVDAGAPIALFVARDKHHRRAVELTVAKYPRMDLADASPIVLAERPGVVDIVTIDRTELEAIYRTKAGQSFVNHF